MNKSKKNNVVIGYCFISLYFIYNIKVDFVTDNILSIIYDFMLKYLIY